MIKKRLRDAIHRSKIRSHTSLASVTVDDASKPRQLHRTCKYVVHFNGQNRSKFRSHTSLVSVTIDHASKPRQFYRTGKYVAHFTGQESPIYRGGGRVDGNNNFSSNQFEVIKKRLRDTIHRTTIRSHEFLASVCL